MPVLGVDGVMPRPSKIPARASRPKAAVISGRGDCRGGSDDCLVVMRPMPHPDMAKSNASSRVRAPQPLLALTFVPTRSAKFRR